MTSPTERTLKEARSRGWKAQVTEKWNPHARIRQDLFGFVDVLCLAEGVTVAIQATSLSNVSARIAKITESENLADMRKCGWRILVWGWGKGANGKIRIREVDLS